MSAPVITTGKTVSNVYEVAKQPKGKYHGWLKQQQKLPVYLLEKAIRSFEKLILEHESWLQDPTRKVPGFYQLPIGQQQHLLEKHWPDDISTFKVLQNILYNITIFG